LKNKQPFKEKLRDLVQKKISGKPRDRKAYQKIIRSLAAKGFDYEDIIRELEVCGFNKPRFSNE
jgi:SOS response regulatory protein OraA/RecX